MKASMDNTETPRPIHSIVKRYAASVGMVINAKKSAIQLSMETPLPQSLQEIPRMDETTYKYLGFQMKKGEVEGKEMMTKLEGGIMEKLDEPTESRRV